MMQVLYWRSTDIRRHCTQFSGPGDLCLRFFTSLV